MSFRSPRSAPGFSLIGLLVTMACVVVLFAVLMTSVNKAVTGQGSTRLGTLRSMEDQLALTTMVQTLIAHAGDHGDRFPVPSRITGSGDRREDTTANLFSAMVALRYVKPETLVSANERSGYVEVMADYDYLAWQPVNGRWWDDRLQADLRDLSHVSWAHLPLFGERFETHWGPSLSSVFPVIGSRGPKDGIPDPSSLTYGREGTWGGHVAFGDGHVEFVDTFTPPGLVLERDGVFQPDNLYAVEDGPGGADAILSFTRRMTDEGPELQWD